MTSMETRRRHPRRRRAFLGLASEDVVALAARHVLDATPAGPGVNNESWIVSANGKPSLVVKLRPRPHAGTRNSPQWPRYTQLLFGTEPNGRIETLRAVTDLLEAHGAIRIARVHAADETLQHVDAAYAVVEYVPGRTFEWDVLRPRAVAGRQLGTHLGRLHEGTSGDRFGIFAARTSPVSEWRERFASSFRMLARDLARSSPVVEAAMPDLEATLEHASSAAAPTETALVCVDQNPTHYVAAADGSIAAMVDVEAHLWAPPELELAFVETWLADFAAFRAAYERVRAWPACWDRIRGAYWLYAWMEWAYCMHTLVHDASRASALEEQLAALASGFAEATA